MTFPRYSDAIGGGLRLPASEIDLKTDFNDRDFMGVPVSSIPSLAAQLAAKTAECDRLRGVIKSRCRDNDGFCIYCYVPEKMNHIQACPAHTPEELKTLGVG